MDTRIGYPNEHLAGDSDAETTSPMYATAVGLVLNSLDSKEKSSMMKRFSHVVEDEEVKVSEKIEEDKGQGPAQVETPEPEEHMEGDSKRSGRRFFERWAEKFKEFLDNAE